MIFYRPFFAARLLSCWQRFPNREAVVWHWPWNQTNITIGFDLPDSVVSKTRRRRIIAQSPVYIALIFVAWRLSFCMAVVHKATGTGCKRNVQFIYVIGEWTVHDRLTSSGFGIWFAHASRNALERATPGRNDAKQR